MIPIFKCGYGGFHFILKLIKKKKDDEKKEKGEDKKLI